MKRNYIIPNTESVAVRAGFVCNVTSVHSDAGLGLGGDANNTGGGGPIVVDPL